MKNWLAGAVLFLAVGWVALVLVHDGWRRVHGAQFHGERFQDVKRGMTEAEVETLLGAPPGDYSTRGYSILTYGIVISEGVRREKWIDDKHMYEVHYTHDNKVAGTHVRDNLRRSQDDPWYSRFVPW